MNETQQQVKNISQQGRYGDSTLVHMNPSEVKGLAQMGQMTINPVTGLPEAFNLRQALGFAAPIVGGIFGGPMGAAAASAAVTTADTGSLKQGLFAGLTSYGLGSAMQAAGGIGSAKAATDAAQTAATNEATKTALADATLTNAGMSLPPNLANVVTDPTTLLNPAGQLSVAQNSVLSPGVSDVFGRAGFGDVIGSDAFLKGNPGLIDSTQAAFQGTFGEGLSNVAGGVMTPGAIIPGGIGMAGTAYEGFKEDEANFMQERQDAYNRRRAEMYRNTPEPILYSAGGGQVLNPKPVMFAANGGIMDMLKETFREKTLEEKRIASQERFDARDAESLARYNESVEERDARANYRQGEYDKNAEFRKSQYEAKEYVRRLAEEYMDGTKTFGQFMEKYGTVPELEENFIKENYPEVYERQTFKGALKEFENTISPIPIDKKMSGGQVRTAAGGDYTELPQIYAPDRATYNVNPNFRPGFAPETMYFNPESINAPASQLNVANISPQLVDNYTGSKGGYGGLQSVASPEMIVDPFQAYTGISPKKGGFTNFGPNNPAPELPPTQEGISPIREFPTPVGPFPMPNPMPNPNPILEGQFSPPMPADQPLPFFDSSLNNPNAGLTNPVEVPEINFTVPNASNFINLNEYIMPDLGMGGYRTYAEGGKLPNAGLEALNKVAPQAVDAMGYDNGGLTPDGQMMPTPENVDPLIAEVTQFILGESDNEEALNMFLTKYGNEAFMALRQQILESLVPNAQTEGMIAGDGNGGMDDDLMGKIGNQERIAVSQDEFIVPADVVSMLGDGSSDAGAKELYEMMDRVRQEKTGTTEQAPKLANAGGMLPA